MGLAAANSIALTFRMVDYAANRAMDGKVLRRCAALTLLIAPIVGAVVGLAACVGMGL